MALTSADAPRRQQADRDHPPGQPAVTARGGEDRPAPGEAFPGARRPGGGHLRRLAVDNAGMRSEAAIDEFRLAYERTGSGPAVLLLHGWPGDRTDYRAVGPLVARCAGLIVPDLRASGAAAHDRSPPWPDVSRRPRAAPR